MSTNGSSILAGAYWGEWRKGREGVKANTNLSLGRSGPSIVNMEEAAFGAVALSHSLKGEEGPS